MDMSKIQRALGFIEGVCEGLKDREAELIEEAVNEIDCELETTSSVTEGKPLEIHYTTGEMEELVERLLRHYDQYEQGKTQRFSIVCADCKKAAELIVHLQLILEDLDYVQYAEQP